jgi:P27 family predicted phage terminase small subunit
MGKRGPLAKPADRAQGHRRRELSIVGAEEAPTIKVPRPPKGLAVDVRKAWAAYWRSPMARLAQDVDRPAITRLFRLYDQHERAMAALQVALVVKGSQGQVRVNPVADYVSKLEVQILRLENELGLTPMSRARLGLTIAQGQLTVEELNRVASEHGRADDDPRVIDVEAIEADA